MIKITYGVDMDIVGKFANEKEAVKWIKEIIKEEELELEINDLVDVEMERYIIFGDMGAEIEYIEEAK